MTHSDTYATPDEQSPPRESLVLSVWLIIASAVGLYAASSLILDKISYWKQLAEGKVPTLGCNINPIVGCGDVINTWQGQVFFHIPNPLIGIVAWSALGAVAIALVTQRRLPSWFWIGLQVGVIFGVCLVTWLQFQTIFRLNALCPWCMVTWSVTIPSFWAVSTRNLYRWRPNTVTRTLKDYVVLPILLHYLVIILVIWNHFGSALFKG